MRVVACHGAQLVGALGKGGRLARRGGQRFRDRREHMRRQLEASSIAATSSTAAAVRVNRTRNRLSASSASSNALGLAEQREVAFALDAADGAQAGECRRAARIESVEGGASVARASDSAACAKLA